MTQKKSSPVRLQNLLPWGAGAGFAIGQMGLTTSCTVVTQGQCVGCAGCVVALVSLVGWGALKNDDDQANAISNKKLASIQIDHKKT